MSYAPQAPWTNLDITVEPTPKQMARLISISGVVSEREELFLIILFFMHYIF